MTAEETAEFETRYASHDAYLDKINRANPRGRSAMWISEQKVAELNRRLLAGETISETDVASMTKISEGLLDESDRLLTKFSSSGRSDAYWKEVKSYLSTTSPTPVERAVAEAKVVDWYAKSGFEMTPKEFEADIDEMFEGVGEVGTGKKMSESELRGLFGEVNDYLANLELEEEKAALVDPDEGRIPGSSPEFEVSDEERI